MPFPMLDKVYVIAEAGVNHNGDFAMACDLITLAKKCGADAVKFQTFKTEKVISKTAPKAEYQKTNTGKPDESQFDMVKGLEFVESQFAELKKLAESCGIAFLSTPFDEGSADVLERIGVGAYKVSSGDLINYPLLTRIASKKKPVILSCGMSSMDEIEFGIATVKAAGNDQIALLHCVSNYPATEADCNMLAIRTLAQKYPNIPMGWSDHTAGDVTAIMAVALGAKIIEKHFTLDKNLPGPDHPASASPEDLQRYIENLRLAEKALGNGIKRIMPSEQNTADVAKRSLIASRDIKKGEVFSLDNLSAQRPANGISPIRTREFLGKTATCDIAAETQITLAMIAEDVAA